MNFAQSSLSETDKLAATAKVWGFLKYYHPNVAGGKYNWDAQLFEVLPKVKNAPDKEGLSQVYIDWIDKLGEVKKCKKCDFEVDGEYFNRNFNLNWIENNQLFSIELTEKLKYIEENRFQGKHHYITTKGKRPDLVIKNEQSYDNFDRTNKQLRLLSLFRYWNTIEYFYPHKYQIDTEWDVVFTQMLPKFISPKSELEFHLAMLELVVKIDDSHGYFFTDVLHEHFGLKQIPAAFKLIDNKAVITHFYSDSLAKLSDIKIGDIITKVENVEIAEVLKLNLKYSNGSNYNAKLKHASSKILNGSTDSVKVEIVRGNENKVRWLARYTFDQFNYRSKQKAWRIIENDIGYINLGIIEKKELTETLSSLTNSKAIILDLRNYPKNYYGSIFRNFLGAQNTIVTKVLKPDLRYPGNFILSNQDKKPNTTESNYKGQVILIVNERTQSRAEYTAMWIQNGFNVTTIGSQTAGAGGFMIGQEFVGGYKSYFTSSGIFYTDMTAIQRKGVKIDIEIKPTIQGIAEGRDEVLEKAIEFLNE